jgi:ribosomal protein S18 acetylase RimI-like enzyme
MLGQGASAIRLVVQKQNARARAFWEKQGFAVEREAVSRNGLLESEVWTMALHL